MTTSWTRVSIAAWLISLCNPLLAQSPDFRTRTDAEMREKFTVLMKKAGDSPTGEAGEKLDVAGNRWLLLMARARTGESEIHELWADEIVIRSGELTLIVGGEMTGKHPYNNLPGEFHGSGLNGGVTYVLHAGDIAYVPANVPHWMKVAAGSPAVVLIFKEAAKK